ncbi:MAG: hypothetical protein KKF41_11800 [Actinobacteria bacterium]|nr:hypothetical protein [Actinomycetota bacterium]MBU1944283.1 hypothetical protein [Actinomycetota bacterium]MBU2688259.1 hypothetical protein [Actinomycetota bacterium]
MMTMTFEQRLSTVLAGRVPDRVPCIPLVYYFAASVAGISAYELISSMSAYRSAIDACFWEAGPFDAMYPLPISMDYPDFNVTYVGGTGLKPVMPRGPEDPTAMLQTPETQTLMAEDDYRAISESDAPGPAGPLLEYMVRLIARNHGEEPGYGVLARRFLPSFAILAGRWLAEMARWRRRGVPFFMSFGFEAPFDTFSMARGVTDISLDLKRRPDEVREAALRMASGMAFIAWMACTFTRVPRFLLMLHRTSNDFISPRQFAEVCYPGVKLIADYLAERGISFSMHCDGNWDANLEIMTTLPENSCFQFDGATDIFRASEVLGDRYVIMGDVDAGMLAYSEPEEVEAYCARLIKEVGANGRFILSSGCELPMNARLENVQAMVRAARTHGRY